MIIPDILNTMLQSMMFVYFTKYCIDRDTKECKDYKKNIIVKFIINIILIFIIMLVLTKLLGQTSISIIIIHIMTMIILIMFNYKKYYQAIIAYSIIYFIFQITILLFGNIYWAYVGNIYRNKELISIIFLYIPQYIMTILIFKNVNKLYKVYTDLITNIKSSFILVLIFTLGLDYILSIAWIVHGNDNPAFKNLFVSILIIFIIFITLYILKLKTNIQQIILLNDALDKKNNELKKVKHDYGAQISYLYGLHLMKNYSRAGILLKGIIDGNNSIPNEILVLNNSNSIINTILKVSETNGINIILDEDVDLYNINIEELELQKILSNIINNAITAMQGKGLLTIKSYRVLNSVIIKIKNNGPKIDRAILKKIFNPGFTTKENDENGFGLVIVKELVEKNKGIITVKSNDEFTEFKIIF